MGGEEEGGNNLIQPDVESGATVTRPPKPANASGRRRTAASLPDSTIASLREVAGQCRTLMRRRTGAKGLCVLLNGGSGTGKTLAAEILGSELKLDHYRVDLAAVVSKYIGETEKNLRKLFDAAEQSGGMLFFDEADALFGKRTNVKDSHDRYANVDINYLLQLIDNCKGIVVAATSNRDNLDEAFLGHVRFAIDLPRRVLKRRS